MVSLGLVLSCICVLDGTILRLTLTRTINTIIIIFARDAVIRELFINRI